MKVVVTGSTGLVGRALIKRLQGSGHEIVPLGRPAWDGEKDVAPPHVMKDADAVIHLAGENVAAKCWSARRKRHLIDSRIKSAEHLKAGLDAAGVQLKIFICASGIGYFGDRGDELLTEDSRPGSDFLAKLCIDWENAAEQIGAKRTVMLRFGAVLTKNGGFLEKVVPLFKFLGAGKLGSGKQWFPWIHIDDAIEVIFRALNDNLLCGPINVVAPQKVTNAQLTEELRAKIGTFRAPSVPPFLLKLFYGELSEALLGSQKAVPRKLEQLGFEFKYRKLKEALTAEFSANA